MQDTNDGKRRGKPRGIRRDRDCGKCRLRGVKCDLNRPRCLPCVQANLPCGDYPQRVVWTGEVSVKAHRRRFKGSTEAISPIKVPERKTALQTPSPSNDSPDVDRSSFIRRLAAFCHQVESFQGQTLSDSHYLSDKTIRLVASLRHFMQVRIEQFPTSPPGHEDATESADAARHRLALLMELNEALSTANPFAILGIAAFAVFDVFDRAFGDWQCHLHGAKSLLDCHCRDLGDLQRLATNVPGLIEIVSRLIWFDVMGSIVRGSHGLIFDNWHLEILNDSFFKVVGCPADVFNLYLRIARGDVLSDPAELCFQAMNQLLNLDTDITDQGHCANAHRFAATVTILSQMRYQNASLSKELVLTSALNRLCQVIISVPSSSQFYVHLATPVYLAGMNATTVHQCDIVRAYWNNCCSAGIPRYRCGLARCEEMWEAKGLVWEASKPISP